MRLRRITAIGAAVATVFATTAAVLPGSPTDRPQPMPALTARALDARYAADSQLIAKAAATATRTGSKPLARSLDGMRGHHFIDFNPRGQGLAVEVIGNLATATRVAILVPGSDTSLATFDSRGTASPQGAALALAAVTCAGCSSAPSSSGVSSANSRRERAVKFAACMRGNGVKAFPDPDASGELTIDAVANRSSLNTDTAAFKKAMTTCRDLQPPGFTGRKRNSGQQKRALVFARCMRDNGISDFPDPTENAPLIDTNRIPSAADRGARDIPGFQAAIDKCHGVLAAALGGQR